MAFLGHLAQAQCAAYGYYTQSGATVTFYDSSFTPNAHDSYWSFGDGSGGFGTPVTHTYSANGTYTATLYIYDSLAMCDDTTYMTVTISGISSCNATLSYSVDSINPLTYYFFGSTPPAGGTSSLTIWDFGPGSGTTYNTQNATHVFSASGNYIAYYIVNDSSGNFCDSVEVRFTVSGSTGPSCNASFNYAVDASNPYKLNFNNTSTNASTAYWWFGGNNSSTLFSPSHTFNSAGYQTVCLTTYDSSGNYCDSVCQTVYVPGQTSNTNCDATFSAYTQSGVTYFYDSTSTSNIIEYSFGDGQYGYSSSPSHTYANPGTYNACLFVYDVDSVGDTLLCDSFCQTVTIAGTSTCVASFLLNVDSANNSASYFPIVLNNNSTGTNFEWSFGNGNTSTASNPSYAYTVPGTYTVCLYVLDIDSNTGVPSICDSQCTTIVVGNTQPPSCTASFSQFPDSINMSANSFPVLFSNSSTGTNYLWNFGDGTSDTAKNPTHVYTASGSYTACLYVLSGYDSLSLPIICDSTCTTVTVGTPVVNCNSSFTYSVDSLNSNRYYFTGTSPQSGGWAEWEMYEGVNVGATTYSGTSATHTFNGNATPIVVFYYTYNADSSLCDVDTANITLSGASCQASYYLGVDTSNLFNLYIINNSTGTTSTTSYFWDFGDGSTSTLQYPTHQYSSFGLYNLCLTISDSASGCSSTHCDTIGLDSNGNLLKRDGFMISVVDEKDLLNIPEVEMLKKISVFPNPSRGEFTLSLQSQKADNVELTVLSSVGQVVSKTTRKLTVGENNFGIALDNTPDGIYFLTVRAGNQVKNIKLYLINE